MGTCTSCTTQQNDNPDQINWLQLTDEQVQKYKNINLTKLFNGEKIWLVILLRTLTLCSQTASVNSFTVAKLVKSLELKKYISADIVQNQQIFVIRDKSNLTAYVYTTDQNYTKQMNGCFTRTFKIKQGSTLFEILNLVPRHWIVTQFTQSLRMAMKTPQAPSHTSSDGIVAHQNSAFERVRSPQPPTLPAGKPPVSSIN